MVIRKWNETQKDYDVVKIPDEWNVPIIPKELGEIVNCVNCGCKMKFGDGFQSKRYHNVSGAAYSECKKCFDEYLPTYFKSRKDKDEHATKKEIGSELEPIIKDFMINVTNVAYKHNAKAAPLIRSAACIVIAESDKIEDKANKLEKLLKSKDSLEDLIKILEDISGDTNDR